MSFQNNSGVKFENNWRSSIPERQPPKMIRWVMKWSGGVVKNERQASWVLLGLVAVAVIATLILIANAFRSPPLPPPGEIIDVAGPQGERL